MKKILLCVPNFSEGQNLQIVNKIAMAMRIPGLYFLGQESDFDTNRTVISLAGAPEVLFQAVLNGAKQAFHSIDMAVQKGVHPRIGALDVCPFIPIQGLTLNDCIPLVHNFGKMLAEYLGVPVYLYGQSALRTERKDLANIRKGQYEGLAAKLRDANWTPDFGSPTFISSWGATAVGARPFLIAWNIQLGTSDLILAKQIARLIRESASGGLPAVKSIGWHLRQRNAVQVSVNVLDYSKTPLHVIYETVCQHAARLGCTVLGSELIGLIPKRALLEAGKFYTRQRHPNIDLCGISDAVLIQTAIFALGLESVTPFFLNNKIVEYALALPESSCLAPYPSQVS